MTTRRPLATNEETAMELSAYPTHAAINKFFRELSNYHQSLDSEILPDPTGAESSSANKTRALLRELLNAFYDQYNAITR